MEYEQVLNSYVCRYCKGSFDHLENLQKHVQQIHTPRSSSKEKTCPLCGLWCVKYETYRDHLKHIHRQSEEGKAFVLKCFNDFFVWKNELEKRNYCKYIIQGPPKVIQPSKDKIHIYRCDSSTPNMKERKSACAVKDSCPSTISVLENAKNHSIKVEYWNNHIGHIIPVQGEELDAAIGSLQTTEIVVDEQSYQSVEQDSESAIYFLTESNDGSFSESYVKETQRKQPPALFQNNGDSSSNNTSKSLPRKFSFKKDPSKKSLSFSGSLASVACMKASVKKSSATPTTSITSSAIETPVSQSTPTTSVTSTEIETSVSQCTTTSSVSSIEMETSDSQSKSETLNLKSKTSLKQKDIKKKCKEEVSKYTKTNSRITAKSKKLKDKEKKYQEKKDLISSSNSSLTSKLLTNVIAPIPSVTSSSQIKVGASPLSESVLSNLKLMVNDGKLNGQFILLNSLESQNGQQSLILCPVDGNLSPGGQFINSVTKGQGAKQRDKGQLSESQQSGKGLITSSSVQNVLTLAENVPCPAGVERTILPPGPSILKKSGKLEKSTELKISPPPGAPKARKRVTRKKTLSVGQKVSNTNVPNQAGPKIIPTTVSPTIKGIISVNSPMNTISPKPSPVVGNKVLPNSFTPGVSFIQINNTLFPINSPAGSNLNSNSIFNSPMSLAPRNLHPPQSVASFSALAPQRTTTLAVNTTKSSVVGTTPISAKSKLPVDNLPMVVIPQLGNNTATMPISPLSCVSAQNSIRKTTASSPMIKSMQTITSSILPQFGKIRSSLIQNNAQFIPSPRLLAITQPCRRPVVPASFGLRGMRPNSPTPTVANTPKVKRVRLPSSRSVANSPIPTKTNVNPTFKATNVNSVVSNTGPISSTPAITIPSTPIAHPQKPGAFIFESSGDLYVLEPIENNKTLKSDLPIEKAKDTKNSSETQSDTENPAIDNDTVEIPLETDDIVNPLNSEKVLDVSPNIVAKVESKPKRPKICPTFSDGKKIAALPQKRRFTEDDSEILKKVKYYNMEMKYLSSQAECKRLKLELARVHVKNKASSEVELMTLEEDFPKEKESTDAMHNITIEMSRNTIEDNDKFVIGQLTESILRQVEKIQTDKELSMNDDLYDKLKDQSTENELKENVKLSLEEDIIPKVVEIEKDEQHMDCETVSCETDPLEVRISGNDITDPLEVRISDNDITDPLEVRISDNDITDPLEVRISDNDITDPLKVRISAEVGENFISSAKSEDKDISNKEIEIKATSPAEVEDESMNSFGIENKSSVNESLDGYVDNYKIMDVPMDNSQIENESKVDETKVTSIDFSETIDNCESKVAEIKVTSIDYSETIDNCESDSAIVNKFIDSLENQPEISSSDVNDEHKSFTVLDDQIQKVEEESAKIQALLNEQIMEINNLERDQYINTIEDAHYFDSAKSNKEQEVLVNSSEDQIVEETLKELEIKYGDKCSDIYTMIRTSVLRSLYADMQELCQENKKLFEELQSLKSHGEPYEVVVEETHIEHL